MPFFNIFSNKKEKTPPNLPLILIDNREKNSLVPSELSKLSHKIQFIQLPIADYLINNSIAIERKTISDLKSSIINKRIFSQLSEIKQFPLRLLIIEGNQSELYNSEILHQNAVRGFLLSAQLDYSVPILFSNNESSTALLISILSRKKSHPISLNPKKISLNKKEQQQYILESFPNVGPKTAQKLLEKFKSLKKIFNAEESELLQILNKKTLDFLSILD